VHLVRNSIRFVSWKNRKAAAAGLKKIYQSITQIEAEQELAAFDEQWDSHIPQSAATCAAIGST